MLGERIRRAEIGWVAGAGGLVPPEFDTFAPIITLDLTLKPFRIKHLRSSNVLG